MAEIYAITGVVLFFALGMLISEQFQYLDLQLQIVNECAGSAGI